MLGGARAGTSKVPPHGPGEQFGSPFLALRGRHRRLAGARGRGRMLDQLECSGFGVRWSGAYPASRQCSLGFTTGAACPARSPSEERGPKMMHRAIRVKSEVCDG